MRDLITEAILEFAGERCRDHHAGCFTCQTWDQFDAFKAPKAKHLADWHEDDGEVLWWRFPVDEAPWVGSPLDGDWPGYHTHWTHLPPVPSEPVVTKEQP